jgi:hypothetical protein
MWSQGDTFNVVQQARRFLLSADSTVAANRSDKLHHVPPCLHGPANQGLKTSVVFGCTVDLFVHITLDLTCERISI